MLNELFLIDCVNILHLMEFKNKLGLGGEDHSSTPPYSQIVLQIHSPQIHLPLCSHIPATLPPSIFTSPPLSSSLSYPGTPGVDLPMTPRTHSLHLVSCLVHPPIHSSTVLVHSLNYFLDDDRLTGYSRLKFATSPVTHLSSKRSEHIQLI